MGDMTDWWVTWHDSFIWVTWLINEWHDSFIRDVTHSLVGAFKALLSPFIYICVWESLSSFQPGDVTYGGHDWLMSDMTHLHVRHDMTHLFVCHDSTWLYSYVWYDLFICVTWLSHMCGMTRSYVCDMTHSYEWHDSYMCDMTHSCVTSLIHVWHDSFMCDVTKSYICDMTHSCVTSLICVRTWHSVPH